MSTLTLELPEPLAEFAAEQAARRGLPKPEDFLVALLRDAHRAAAQAHLEELLLAGANSGPPIVADDVFWADLHRRYEGRHGEESAS